MPPSADISTDIELLLFQIEQEILRRESIVYGKENIVPAVEQATASLDACLALAAQLPEEIRKQQRDLGNLFRQEIKAWHEITRVAGRPGAEEVRLREIGRIRAILVSEKATIRNIRKALVAPKKEHAVPESVLDHIAHRKKLVAEIRKNPALLKQGEILDRIDAIKKKEIYDDIGKAPSGLAAFLLEEQQWWGSLSSAQGSSAVEACLAALDYQLDTEEQELLKEA